METKEPFDQEKELSHLMDQFHVTVPDFPAQKTPMDRVGDLLFSEAPNPLQSMSLTTSSITLIQTIPVAVAVVIPGLLLWLL
ncbi:hypothetical protein GCM10008967_07600 [Bacillus carboniphilus]|uniref:Uncharacterized protein n=1 Tax=Bacillus carboniphilus TaxID=86663 RepID=A0ABN0VX76_9BACI